MAEEWTKFRNILVAYDGSVFSKVVLDQAVEIARLCQAELHLLGIVQTTGGAALTEGVGAVDVWGLERKQIEAALEAACRELANSGLNAITNVREGDPAEEIVFSAIAMTADLVVLGQAPSSCVAASDPSSAARK